MKASESEWFNQRQKDPIDRRNTNIHGNNKYVQSVSGTLLSTCRKMYKINFWYLTYHEMSATSLTYTKLSGIEMSNT